MFCVVLHSIQVDLRIMLLSFLYKASFISDFSVHTSSLQNIFFNTTKSLLISISIKFIYCQKPAERCNMAPLWTISDKNQLMMRELHATKKCTTLSSTFQGN